MMSFSWRPLWNKTVSFFLCVCVCVVVVVVVVFKLLPGLIWLLFNFRPIPNTVSIKFRKCPIKFLEHVQIKVDLDFSRRGDLSLQLKAPSGTISPMTRKRFFDIYGIKNLTDWVMTTLFNWGESPEGEWELTIADLDTIYPSTGNLFLGLLLLLLWLFFFSL